MQGFVFQNPTKIVFGCGCIPKVGKYALQQGRKALLLYGSGSIKANGIYDQVTASLRQAGIQWVEHSGVKSNPVLSHTREGIELAKAEQVDMVIPVGGGSVLDEGKAIAAGAMTDGDVWDFFVNKAQVEAALPLVTVLTLAATASEMNNGGVVTNEATAQKFNINSPWLFPKVSILDPEATYTVAADYTAYSGVDAISHLIEGYFTSSDPYTPLQDRLVEGLVTTLMESTEGCLEQPQNADYRSTMMWGATLGLNGLAVSGIGAFALPNHMIEHSLSALYDIAHGAGLSIVIPGWMAYQIEQQPQKFAQFAQRVFGIQEGDVATQAEKGRLALKDWFARIGAPVTLEQGDIPNEAVEELAANATMLAQKWGLAEAYPQEVIGDILRRCR